MTISTTKSLNVWRRSVVFAVLLLAGCAAGVNITRPDPQSLINGETTYEDVVGRYGAPWAEGSISSNEHTLKAVVYAYASLGAASHAPDTGGAARGLNLWFENDVLVGHQFSSSFESDHTDFDETRLGEIRKGESDRAAVMRVFGEPTGEYIYPMMKEKDQVGLVYSYLHTKPGLLKSENFQKRLLVSIDDAGIVRDVEYVVANVK